MIVDHRFAYPLPPVRVFPAEQTVSRKKPRIFDILPPIFTDGKVVTPSELIKFLSEALSKLEPDKVGKWFRYKKVGPKEKGGKFHKMLLRGYLDGKISRGEVGKLAAIYAAGRKRHALSERPSWLKFFLLFFSIVSGSFLLPNLASGVHALSIPAPSSPPFLLPRTLSLLKEQETINFNMPQECWLWLVHLIKERQTFNAELCDTEAVSHQNFRSLFNKVAHHATETKAFFGALMPFVPREWQFDPLELIWLHIKHADDTDTIPEKAFLIGESGDSSEGSPLLALYNNTKLLSRTVNLMLFAEGCGGQENLFFLAEKLLHDAHINASARLPESLFLVENYLYLTNRMDFLVGHSFDHAVDLSGQPCSKDKTWYKYCSDGPYGDDKNQAAIVDHIRGLMRIDTIQAIYQRVNSMIHVPGLQTSEVIESLFQSHWSKEKEVALFSELALVAFCGMDIAFSEVTTYGAHYGLPDDQIQEMTRALKAIPKLISSCLFNPDSPYALQASYIEHAKILGEVCDCMQDTRNKVEKGIMLDNIDAQILYQNVMFIDRIVREGFKHDKHCASTISRKKRHHHRRLTSPLE